MDVRRIWASKPDQPLTDPFPNGKGFFFCLVSGDVAHPYHGNWFQEPIFDRCWRFFTQVPLPFFSWDFGFARGYAGAKVWGMDEQDPKSGIYDQFRRWLAPADVYPGSRAIHFSIRNGLTPFVMAIPPAIIYGLIRLVENLPA